MSQQRDIQVLCLLKKTRTKDSGSFYVPGVVPIQGERTLGVKLLVLRRMGKCLQDFSLLPHMKIFAEVPQYDVGPWSQVQRPWDAVSWAREVISKTE